MNMKMTKLLAVTLFVSTAAFAQNGQSPKDTHGSLVSATAKTETEAEIKGANVSSVASGNAQTEVEVDRPWSNDRSEAVKAIRNEQAEQNAEIKTAIKANHQASKDELAALRSDFKANSKATLEASKAEIKDLKSEIKANKEASIHASQAVVVKPSTKIKNSLRTTAKLNQRSVNAAANLKIRGKLRAL